MVETLSTGQSEKRGFYVVKPLRDIVLPAEIPLASMDSDTQGIDNKFFPDDAMAGIVGVMRKLGLKMYEDIHQLQEDLQNLGKSTQNATYGINLNTWRIEVMTRVGAIPIADVYCQPKLDGQKKAA